MLLSGLLFRQGNAFLSFHRFLKAFGVIFVMGCFCSNSARAGLKDHPEGRQKQAAQYLSGLDVQEIQDVFTGEGAQKIGDQGMYWCIFDVACCSEVLEEALRRKVEQAATQYTQAVLQDLNTAILIPQTHSLGPVLKKLTPNLYYFIFNRTGAEQGHVGKFSEGHWHPKMPPDRVLLNIAYLLDPEAQVFYANGMQAFLNYPVYLVEDSTESEGVSDEEEEAGIESLKEPPEQLVVNTDLLPGVTYRMVKTLKASGAMTGRFATWGEYVLDDTSEEPIKEKPVSPLNAHKLLWGVFQVILGKQIVQKGDPCETEGGEESVRLALLESFKKDVLYFLSLPHGNVESMTALVLRRATHCYAQHFLRIPGLPKELSYGESQEEAQAQTQKKGE